MASVAEALKIHSEPEAANGIRQGDCLSLLQSLDDESVDLTVFSPPYDNIRDYEGEWAVDLSVLGSRLFRVTKQGGICAVVIGDGTKDFAKSLTTFSLATDWCREAGWRLFECCIYQRDGNPGACQDLHLGAYSSPLPIFPSYSPYHPLHPPLLPLPLGPV